jgi:hypothetical protein
MHRLRLVRSSGLGLPAPLHRYGKVIERPLCYLPPSFAILDYPLPTYGQETILRKTRWVPWVTGGFVRSNVTEKAEYAVSLSRIQ